MKSCANKKAFTTERPVPKGIYNGDLRSWWRLHLHTSKLETAIQYYEVATRRPPLRSTEKKPALEFALSTAADASWDEPEATGRSPRRHTLSNDFNMDLLCTIRWTRTGFDAKRLCVRKLKASTPTPTLVYDSESFRNSPSMTRSTSASIATDSSRPPRCGRRWTPEEHARYLTALELYPYSSWKVIATFVGTRTVRQVMSHAQKLAQKQQRHARGLKTAGRRPQGTTTVDEAPTPVKRQRQRAAARERAAERFSAPDVDPLHCPVSPIPMDQVPNGLEDWSAADWAVLASVDDGAAVGHDDHDQLEWIEFD